MPTFQIDQQNLSWPTNFILIQSLSTCWFEKDSLLQQNGVLFVFFFYPLKHMDAYIFSSWLSSCSTFILGCFYFNWMKVNVREKAWVASNAESAQTHFIPYTSAEVHLTILQSGGIDLHSDLVDIWRGYGLCPLGGGLWQLHEGVQQEAGVPAQHPHLHAGWSAHSRWPAEGHDHLHHWRPRKGCGGQDYCPEGKKAKSFTNKPGARLNPKFVLAQTGSILLRQTGILKCTRSLIPTFFKALRSLNILQPCLNVPFIF